MATVSVDCVYPHPREKVWRAITDARALSEWLMPNDFEPRVGHRFTFQTDPAPGFDGIVHCEVQELNPPTQLVFTWVGGPVDTVVTFTLDEVAGGTRLRMRQIGFRGVKAWLVSRILQSGSKVLYGQKLPAVLDRMDSDGGLRSAEEMEEEACMSLRTRLWTRVTSWFTKEEEEA